MTEGNDSASFVSPFVATVPADAAGQRLDRWLAGTHSGHSRSRLKVL